MIGLLLAVSIPCMDGWQMIDRISKNEWLEPQTKEELIVEIKKVMDCNGRQKEIN